MMRWFACFSPSPTVENRGSQNSKANLGNSQSDLSERQDSAYALQYADSFRIQTPDNSARRSTGEKIKAKLSISSQITGSTESIELEEDQFQREYDSYSGPMPAELSISESTDGKPASLVKYGPPKPACNQARLQNLEELGLLNKEAGDPQIQHIMQLMCTVFNTQSALVALVGEEKIFIHDALNFKKGDFGWRQSLCAHTLSPQNHQVMIVEDAKNDARFAHLPLITHDKVGFYAGTPIVSSRGHRLGTVCFVAGEARKFDAEGSQMLINMGELITRELERDWMTAQTQTSKPEDTMQGLLRAAECFNDAVMFIDTSQQSWKILHLNTAAQAKFKLYDVAVDVDGEKPVLIWDLFQPYNTDSSNNTSVSSSWRKHAGKIRNGQDFSQTVRFKEGHTSNSRGIPGFTLSFRCAATNNIDSNAASVGAPAFLPTTASNHHFYFVTMTVDHNSRTSGQSLLGALTGRVTGQVPFKGVELGTLLGKGGYGSVYRGVRSSEDSSEATAPQIVAIKIIENVSDLRMHKGQPLETSITQGSKHRNIVNTLDYALIKGQEDSDKPHQRSPSMHDSAQSRSCGGDQVWLMLEYCDCGSLQEASEKGWFRVDGVIQLPSILAVAHDIAQGLAFLHKLDVAHGDLTGGNVLLAKDETTKTGLVAKVADFGLARNLDMASKIETRTYGTVTHMPPELLEKGIFTKACDSFAFGVLMWEMWHGVRAWSSLTFAQIITAVVANKKSLQFNADAPKDYADLANRCMHIDPTARPGFDEIVESLEHLQNIYPAQS